MSREIRFDYIIRSKMGELLHCPYTLNQIQDSTKLTDIELEGRIVAKRMFTGLKDKNGVEIYHHDLVLHGKRLCEVVWVQSMSCWKLRNRDKAHDADDDWLSKSYTLEVVGNIIENSELLNPQSRSNKDE